MILILQYSGCIDGTFHNRGIEKSNKYKSKFTCQCLNRTLPSRKCSNKEGTHAKSVKSVYDLTEICIQLSKRLDPLCLLSIRIFFHEFVYYCCSFEKTHKYDMHFMIVRTYNMPSYVTLCALETGQQIALLLVYLNQIFFVIFVFAENIG